MRIPLWQTTLKPDISTSHHKLFAACPLWGCRICVLGVAPNTIHSTGGCPKPRPSQSRTCTWVFYCWAKHVMLARYQKNGKLEVPHNAKHWIWHLCLAMRISARTTWPTSWQHMFWNSAKQVSWIPAAPSGQKHGCFWCQMMEALFDPSEPGITDFNGT